MAGKKDYNLVVVTTGLTKKQASSLMSAVCSAKNEIAPLSRSTAGITTREGISGLLQNGMRMISGK